MTVITPTVHGERLVREARKFFTATAWLSELAQNSYRANASEIRIICEGTDVIYSDNGTGLQTRENWLHLLSLGSTGWQEDIVANQTPAGIGVLALLLNHEAEIHSGPFSLHTRPTDLIDTLALEQPITIQDAKLTKGFSVRIKDGLELLAAKVNHGLVLEKSIGPMLLTMSGEPMQLYVDLVPHENWSYKLESCVKAPYVGPVSDFTYDFASFLGRDKEIEFPIYQFESMWTTATVTRGTKIPNFTTNTLCITPAPSYTPATRINFHGKTLKGPKIPFSSAYFPHGLTWFIHIHGDTPQPFDLVLPERNAVIENERWASFVEEYIKPLFQQYVAAIDTFSQGAIQPAILSTQPSWLLSLPQLLEEEGFTHPLNALPADTPLHRTKWLTKIPQAYDAVDFFTSLPPYNSYGSHNTADTLFPYDYYEDVLPPLGLTDIMAAMRTLPQKGVTVGNFLLHDKVPQELQCKFIPLDEFQLDFVSSEGKNDDTDWAFQIPYNFGNYRLFLCPDVKLQCTSKPELTYDLNDVPYVFFGDRPNTGEGSYLYATQPFIDAMARKCPNACRQLYDLITASFNPSEDRMNSETDQLEEFLGCYNAILNYSEPLPKLADMAGQMVRTLIHSTATDVSAVLHQAGGAKLHIKSLKLSQTQSVAALKVVVEAPDVVFKGSWVDNGGWTWDKVVRNRPSTT